MKTERGLFLAIMVCGLTFLQGWAGEKPSAPDGNKKILATQTKDDLRPAPVPIPPGPFDLQTCYELAILHSETIGLKAEDIRVAQARYWQAVSAVFPKVHVITTENVQNSSTGSSGLGGGSSGSINNGSTSGTQSSGNFSSGKDQFLSRLNVKQPIFSGFRDAAVSSARKAEIEARKQDQQRSLQLLYLDVSDVFYQILMYQGDLRLLNDNRIALEKRSAEVERRVKLGRSRAGDLLATKSQQAETLVSIENTKGLLGASTEVMNFLTGLSGPTPELKNSQTLPSAEALESYLTETRERPDILAAIQTEKAARKNLSAAKGEHWPTISAEGNYFLKEHPQSSREWNILLTCDIPLFEGGAIEARVREQKALVRSSGLSLEQLRRTADKDVRIAYNNFLATAAQAACLRELKSGAEENYRLQSEDYKRGVASNLDALDALTRMHDARRRLADAEMDASVNLVRLHVAAGKSSR